jgi:hypothetical protein
MLLTFVCLLIALFGRSLVQTQRSAPDANRAFLSKINSKLPQREIFINIFEFIEFLHSYKLSIHFKNFEL